MATATRGAIASIASQLHHTTKRLNTELQQLGDETEADHQQQQNHMTVLLDHVQNKSKQPLARSTLSTAEYNSNNMDDRLVVEGTTSLIAEMMTNNR